ncbi:MAG: hypothetical protein JSW14_02380 [Candidatus Bathyarchaeum sp.]|nr:MAG: hypothetical protein JSW14_02380 [Candidatus Bathyarchaeum sp.]
MSSKGQRNRLTFSWTAPKGLLTIAFFLALALISELFMVSIFTVAGLTEAFAFKFFTITISPLFHLLPLGVVIVLVSSWIYLTKHLAKGARRKSQPKVSQIRRRHPRRRKARLSFLRRIFGAIENLFSQIGSFFLRSRGVSFVQRRLSFGRLTFESTVTVLTIFLLSIILLSVLVYPHLINDFAIELYSGNSALHGFVLKIVEVLQGIANALAPIVSAIDGGLRAIAPGFRNAFGGLVTSSPPSLTGGDLLWRYVFCQNAAAWVSALSALAYGKYFSKTYRIRK